MFDASVCLSQRLRDLDQSLDLALRLQDKCKNTNYTLGSSFEPDELEIMSNLPVVVAVGALDEFIKMSSIDLITAYLLGKTKREYSPNIDIPINWIPTTRGLDTRKSTMDHQFQNIVIQVVWKRFQRDNFQSLEKISYQCTKLAIGKPKRMVSASAYNNFKEAIDVKANRRHEIVHRLGRRYNRFAGSNYPEETEEFHIHDRNAIYDFCRELNILFMSKIETS